MSYTKTTWTNDITPINASNMNKIEDKIENLDNDIILLSNNINYLNNFLGLEYKMVGSKKFVKLTEQNLNKYRVYFDNNRSTLFQLHPYSYSILGLIDRLTYQQGIYEFIYEDVTNNISNQWSQTSNPIFNSGTSGYTAINIQSSTNWGTGLRKQSTSCYIDGCTGTSWYWCICSFLNYNGGMPAGAGENISQHVRLWLRVE